MKIILTGSTGFIGSHLIKRLVREECEIHAVVIDESCLEEYEKINVRTYFHEGSTRKVIDYFTSHRFDGVIHLASCFLIQHESHDIDNLINSNVLFSTQILEAAAKSGVKWFINTGTFWQHYENSDYSPVNLYAATKQAFEDIAKYYVETAEMVFTTIKLNDTYGPNDTRRKIFNLWYESSPRGEKLAMSLGGQIMDIVYIDDVIEAYMQLMGLLMNGDPGIVSGSSFSVSAKQRMTLKNLAEIFQKTTGRKLNIEWGGREYRPREVMIPWDKGVPVPGWEQRVSFEKGIKRVFSQMEDRDENGR